MLGKFLSYLIFTNKCKYCDSVIDFGKTLCDECENDLPRIESEKCISCGVEKSECVCKKSRQRYDGISSPFYYEKGIERGIRLFKFSGREYIGKVLAQDMTECVKRDFNETDFDFIVFVPFGKSQKRKRKYNPAQELAKGVSKQSGIPVRGFLYKQFDTETQHLLRGSLRKGNIAGVYDTAEDADLKGKTVLLVDDIKTTGATLNECARVLKIAGAQKVYCTVAAIAKSKEKQTPF